MTRTHLDLPIFLATLVAASTLASAQDPAGQRAQPRIEVVFALDTTGSMSGLIESAKEKVWSIANALAMTRPTPRIRMGLVAYRDRGDDYATQRTDLSEDLDALHTSLMSLQAAGGGDGPESVNQALHEAVTMSSWSEGAGVYRVIYLVGDYPPHMDYDGEVQFPESCKLAAGRGIAINTVQCGNHTDTTPIWQEIARLAEGTMFQVDQDGGATTIATPFDARIAELSRKLDETRVWYGTHAQRTAQIARCEANDAVYTATLASQVERCMFNEHAAGGANWLFGGQELLNDLASDQVKLADIPTAQLPEALRDLDVEARARWVADRQTERTALREQIAELTAQRAEYLRTTLDAATVETRAAWDAKVLEAARAQATRAGIDLGGC